MSVSYMDSEWWGSIPMAFPDIFPDSPDPDMPFITVFITGQKAGSFPLLTWVYSTCGSDKVWAGPDL